MSNIKICWYLAAVVKTQVCKHMIQIGDSVNEFHVWGEINVLRYVYIEPFPLIPSALFYSFVEWLWLNTALFLQLEVSSSIYDLSDNNRQRDWRRASPTRETAHATYGGHRSHDDARQTPRGWHPVIPIFSPHCFPRQRVINHWCTFAHEPTSGRC